MVAREKHKDGTPHLHALLWLQRRVDFRSYKSLDEILGLHGSYEVMKSPVDAVRYLMKENDYVAFGFDPKEYVQAGDKHAPRSTEHTNKWKRAVTTIQEGGPLANFEDQAFIARNLRKLVEYNRWWSAQHLVHRTGDDWKVRSIVLWGVTGVGKSYWARRGKHGLGGSIYVLPYQRDGGVWWDGYGGERVLVLDDFDPKKMPLLQLLRVLDSYAFTGMVKGSSVKADWTEVIITNNHSPETWYPKASYERQRALLRRLKVCWVGDDSFREKSFDELLADDKWPEHPMPLASSALLAE